MKYSTEILNGNGDDMMIFVENMYFEFNGMVKFYH